MKLFEYAVLYHPHQTKEQRDRGESARSELIIDVQRVLARDDKEVNLVAARGIPEKFLDKLDRIEVAVRPF